MLFLSQMPDTPLFMWVVLPLLIFCARVCDVTLGTLRIIFVSRGKRSLAPVLGFFEVSIWLMAISQIMQNLSNVACLLGYAGGFAMGNFVGILIEDKLAIGTVLIRIILVKDETGMKQRLHDAGFGVTSVDAHGMSGSVELIYSLVKRRDLPKAVEIIERCQSNAFYSIEDAKSVNKGIFPSRAHLSTHPLLRVRRRP